MPPFININNAGGVPNTKGIPVVKGFADGTIPFFEERNYTITGITKDSSGVALGGCTVMLFNTSTCTLEQQVVSDASGNFTFIVDKTKKWFEVSYKVGTPDVAGTTVNTLVGT